jgi:hypothetical protein
MADQNPQHGRRQHFHRGRRGNERRGNERRGPGPVQPAEQGSRDHREHVDVEQIMRDIRARISQRHGIELTTQQIQELAARRLEAILDPRTVKPSLLEQIRRSASTPADTPAAPEATYSFEDHTLYDSPRGSLMFIRRLLNPLLRLFFNPNPLISALNTQGKLNQGAAQREADRDRRQTEWNALHYDVLQRLVLEIARTSIEAQQLSMRVEALSAKVEFAERRARSIEGTLHQTRPAPRHESSAPPMPPVAAQTKEAPAEVPSAPVAAESSTGEGGRRRRRRRRGRRPQGFTPEGAAIGAVAGAALPETTRALDGAESADEDEPDDDDGGPDVEGAGDGGVEVAGDEGDSVFSDVASSIATEAAPVQVPIEPTPAPDVPVGAAPLPAAEATTTPQSESAVIDLPDRPRQPDPFGD